MHGTMNVNFTSRFIMFNILRREDDLNSVLNETLCYVATVMLINVEVASPDNCQCRNKENDYDWGEIVAGNFTYHK